MILNPYTTTWEKFFTMLSVLLGLVSVLLTGWSVYQVVLPAPWIVVKDLCIFGTLLILTLYFFLEYRKYFHRSEELKRINDDQILDFQRLVAKQTEAFYGLMSDTRETLYNQSGGSSITKPFDYQQDETKSLLYELLDSVTSALVRIMKNHIRVKHRSFDEMLSISVKAVVLGSVAKQLAELDSDQEASVIDDNEYVITLDRDHRTKKELKNREVKKHLYKTNDNTAFTKLFHGSGVCFCENNLRKLSEHGHYENQNEKWMDIYNATLVVPIWPHGQNSNKPRIFGFLAIDCVNASELDVFDSVGSREIMAFGADLLALIFLNLEMFDEVKTAGLSSKY
ncbi:MAG: hypothetical protein H6974_12260 [Gammaproteobacteria bacterium]|nr:hypothetical protein [Gammaproteobacteria bacterium]